MSDDELRQTVIYHQAEPQAVQSQYTEFDNVDFVINVGEGRSLLKNSVRILGDVLIATSNDPADRCAVPNVGWNRNAGAHCFIQSLQVSAQNAGLIENLQNYPRMVNMVSIAGNDQLDLINSDRLCELRGHIDELTNLYSLGDITYVEAGGTAVTQDFDFSIKPMCALNAMSGDDLPQSKSGSLTLTCNLARNVDALRGREVTANYGYYLTNLRCTFQSVLDAPGSSQTGMRTTYGVKSNALSGTATISANVPALCSGVSISFIATYKDSTLTYDSYACERPQNISEVTYNFNDQTNSLVSYVISDQTEMLERYINSLENTGHNQVALDIFKSNEGFGLGLDFDGLVDLSKNRFTMQLQSDVNDNPANVYMYFHSIASL